MLGLEKAPQCNTTGAFSATAESDGSSLNPNSTNVGDVAAGRKMGSFSYRVGIF